MALQTAEHMRNQHGGRTLRTSTSLGLRKVGLFAASIAFALSCASADDTPGGSGGTQAAAGAAAVAGAGAGGSLAGGSGGTAGTGAPPTGGSSGTAGTFAGNGGAGGAGAGAGGAGATGALGGTAGLSAGQSGQSGAGAGGASGGTPANGGSAGAGAGGAGAGGVGGVGGAGNGGASGAGAGGAGNAGASGSSGSGGAQGYEPCPTTGPCKILPLGDSITWGIQYDGAYRVQLFTRAVNDGHSITFTGSLSNGPSMAAGQTFPKSNEGHSGWTIDQDAGLIPSPALNTIPNIVTLMIGTNDVYAQSGQSTMPNRLGSLIDKITAAAPDALLVVAKITPLANASWNATIKTYNDAIPGVVDTRVAAGKHLMVVDMNTGFTSGMLSSDSIHPNKSGYDFMGNVWYEAIKDFLP